MNLNTVLSAQIVFMNGVQYLRPQRVIRRLLLSKIQMELHYKMVTQLSQLKTYL